MRCSTTPFLPSKKSLCDRVKRTTSCPAAGSSSTKYLANDLAPAMATPMVIEGVGVDEMLARDRRLKNERAVGFI